MGRNSAAACATALILSSWLSGCHRPTLLGPGAPAPKIEAKGWAGGRAPTDSDLAGHVVVLDVWAYW